MRKRYVAEFHSRMMPRENRIGEGGNGSGGGRGGSHLSITMSRGRTPPSQRWKEEESSFLPH